MRNMLINKGVINMVYVIVMDFCSAKVDIYPNVLDEHDYERFVSEKGYRLMDVEYMVVEKLEINYR